MTKYSTGSSNDPDPEKESASCTMCGSTDNLRKGELAGAKVVLCSSCSESDTSQDESTEDTESESDSVSYDSEDNDEPTGYTITNPDSSWVKDDRPDYGNTNTPYLEPNYSEKVSSRLADSDYTKKDLSEVTGVPEEAVEEVLSGNAIGSGVSQEAIEAIQNCLDVDIIEES